MNPTNPTGELFSISGYKYTDYNHTEAKVFITGNFGTSASDDRMFMVKKINGVITTKEVPCKKYGDQGTCPIDSN